MKVSIDQRQHPGGDDAVELAMLRYKLAYAEYQDVVDRNNELNLSGGRPSPRARLDEELAFEELDSARHALFIAAAEAFPTIH